jgi:hypothetical protein
MICLNKGIMYKKNKRRDHATRTENNLIALVALLRVHLSAEQDARVLLAGGSKAHIKMVGILGHPVLRIEYVSGRETLLQIL